MADWDSVLVEKDQGSAKEIQSETKVTKAHWKYA